MDYHCPWPFALVQCSLCVLITLSIWRHRAAKGCPSCHTTPRDCWSSRNTLAESALASYFRNFRPGACRALLIYIYIYHVSGDISRLWGFTCSNILLFFYIFLMENFSCTIKQMNESDYIYIYTPYSTIDNICIYIYIYVLCTYELIKPLL